MGTTEILARHINTAGVLLAPAPVDEAQALIEALETLPSLHGLIAVLQGGR